MKKCPFCAEEIQDAAIKCRHCMEFLDHSRRPAALGAPVQPGNSLPWYYKTSFIVLTFVTVPPFALPLVWLHPRLHIAWKAVITVLIASVCWVSYKAFTGFVHQLDEATRMINEMRF